MSFFIVVTAVERLECESQTDDLSALVYASRIVGHLIDFFYFFLAVVTRGLHLRMLPPNWEQKDDYILVTTEHEGNGIKCGLGAAPGECGTARIKR